MDEGIYTDEQIIKKILHGEVDLYKIIVEKYQQYIFNLGMRFHKNREDAYDFVQDVFLKAYEKLHTFRGTSKYFSWLVRIAYNHGINSAKTKIIDSSLVETYIKSDDATPEETHLREELRKALLKAVEALPEKYRLCIDLYFFYGLSYREIEMITDIPLNTIKSNMLRAKIILRDTLRGGIADEHHKL
ncbi:MAG: sigma-70 family RNA polymerase sigma factor [Spirochaetota bacterium]|nr:sigma-70 family RNA polymerase sigma factor [Spirochaetota bacterium]